MPGKKKSAAAEEKAKSYLPISGPNENVFGVAHIYSTFNDTFVHVTDLSGRETFVKITGGMLVKAPCDEGSAYAAMLASKDVAQRCLECGVTALHIKVRARGGPLTKNPGPGAQPTFRTLARNGMKIGRIVAFAPIATSSPFTPEDVTRIPTDSTRRKAGRRGRRL